MYTILVVDDDKNQRILYQQELSEVGYQVLLAQNGKEALEIVEKNKPDLVVLDIRMPKMDGMEALGRILGKNNKIPVILNTAYSNYKEDFMSWAADAYVIKSSDLSELKSKIKEALNKKGESV